jgi:uncharacterized repeat protein (TIGR03803 family)
MKTKLFWKPLIVILVAWPATVYAQVTVLHSFSALVTETNIQGDYPVASLLLSGNTLYGTTPSGGLSYQGTVFKINTDGSGYAGLYSFTGGIDGGGPSASLILSGNTLYGTTADGGSSSNGTVFAINTDGSRFTNLYSFSAMNTSLENDDGANPAASLVLSGDMLYGTTPDGGADGYGTVFGLSTNTLFFTNLYNFTGGNDGGSPMAGLVLSNDVLYGTTTEGGTNYSGTIFTIGLPGPNFTNLYDFTGGSDGAYPEAGLILSDDWLYGSASGGGFTGNGTIFALKTGGSGFTNLYEFQGGNDGAAPSSGLIMMGDTLYGTTLDGGSFSNGTVFALNEDGSFTNLHSFSALNTNFENSDGINPQAGLVLAGSTLFGMARYGGMNYGYGTIFALNTNGNVLTTLLSFDPLISGQTFQGNSDGSSPQGGTVLSGNTLYGTADYGGAGGNGTIFSMQTDGSNFTTLYSFTGQNDGSLPAAGLILSGNTLYGTAEHGGLGSGVVFSIETSGSDFTVIYPFSSLDTNFENGDGSGPVANLLLSGNTLFGTTAFGGAKGNGTVFAVTTDGLHFTNLHSFSALTGFGTNDDGAYPAAGLVLSNNILYGTAQDGGAAGYGTVFALPANGSGFTNLYSFTNGTDGAKPMAPLFLTNGILYGTAVSGGAYGYGAMFGIDIDGSGFTNIHSFADQVDGGNPMGGLVGDQVFVPLANGGTAFAGAIFSMNLNGTSPVGTSLAGGAGGSYPVGQLSLLPDGTVVVTAEQGGAAGNGAILAVTEGPELAATLESSNGNITIPDGGSGGIEAPVNTRFDYTFKLNTNINPNAVYTISGPLANGFAGVSENESTGVWSFTGEFTQSGAYSVAIEVQVGASTYWYTLKITVCNPPTITNVVAANTNALLNPGSQIIITGTSLSSATQVLFNYPTFGNTNAVPGTNLQINSDNQITVTVPNGASTAPIGVFTPCGYFITAPAVVIGNPPTITLSSPALAGDILSFDATGPLGTYTIMISTDLQHWAPVYNFTLDKLGDPGKPRKLGGDVTGQVSIDDSTNPRTELGFFYLLIFAAYAYK